MTSSVSQLITGIFKALLTDAELVTLLGGAKIYDRLPEKIEPPYVVVGRTTTSDWSTSTEGGEAITLFIHVWSNALSGDEDYRIQDRLKHVLGSAEIALQDHQLIHLRFQYAETRRDRQSAHVHGVMRFRGVTEPLN